jgi:hypothetical protein
MDVSVGRNGHRGRVQKWTHNEDCSVCTKATRDWPYKSDQVRRSPWSRTSMVEPMRHHQDFSQRRTFELWLRCCKDFEHPETTKPVWTKVQHRDSILHSTYIVRECCRYEKACLQILCRMTWNSVVRPKFKDFYMYQKTQIWSYNTNWEASKYIMFRKTQIWYNTKIWAGHRKRTSSIFAVTYIIKLELNCCTYTLTFSCIYIGKSVVVYL